MKISPSAAPHLQPTPATAAKLRQAGEDFTATALNELLAPLFEGLPQDGGLFGGGGGEAAFRPMLIQEMAKSMAKQGGLGITDIVTQAMLRLQEKRS
ncbi:MAG TPA: rod-binding protein [Acetobacteraceae bacterium]|nr:rod-binding protein [Acetobacteraceae bacterium]